jgi:hypothetical protein
MQDWHATFLGRQRLPRGSEVPESVRAIVRTRIDPPKIEAAWDRIVHLAASVLSGHASAQERVLDQSLAGATPPLRPQNTRFLPGKLAAKTREPRNGC